MPPPDTRVTLYIVIVLYKMDPATSPTFQTLLRSLEEPAGCTPHYKILLYDNTPSAQHEIGLPGGVEYFASSANTGLSDAYNLAAARARAEGFEWLLTLDQDTDLPVDFIPKLTDLSATYSAEHTIAAIVPHISAGARALSPSWFAVGGFPRWFARGYQGIPRKGVYAFNSGALIRVSAIEAIGGYSPLFWLDNCDNYIFRQIAKRHLKVYVAGNIELQHDLSMLDIVNKMSLFRYRNAVEAHSAFFDMEMGPVAGLEHTLRLIRRYMKQLLLSQNEFRRITAEILRGRLLVPKARRIEAWVAAQHRRIESSKGSRS